MGNKEAADGMVRIDIAELARELRATLRRRAGGLGTLSEPTTTQITSRNHDDRGARRLRLVEPCIESGGSDR